MKYFYTDNATAPQCGVHFTIVSTQGMVHGVAAVEDEEKIGLLLNSKCVSEITKERHDLWLAKKNPPKPAVRHVTSMFSPASRAPEARAPITSSNEPTLAESVVESSKASKVGRLKRKASTNEVE